MNVAAIDMERNGIIDPSIKKQSALLQSCTILSGIGSKFAEKLLRLGIVSLHDLLLHRPFRYQDKTKITAIADLQADTTAVIVGTIRESYWLKTKKAMYHCKLQDDSSEINIIFFNMSAFQQKRLQRLTTIRAFGEVKYNSSGLIMMHPEIELVCEIESNTSLEYLTPFYPSTHGLNQNNWRKIIQQLFTTYQESLDQLEWLDANFLNKHNLPTIKQALDTIHFPKNNYTCEELLNPKHPINQRLALEELIVYALRSLMFKTENLLAKSTIYPPVSTLENQLLAQLPFSLTAAQTIALTEIKNDLNRSHPMLRLLQGDVGSGKTVVCALAALPIMAQGHQVAFMAPTDILSEQHFHNLSKWLTPLNFKVIRLNKTTSTKEKKQNRQDLASGLAHMVVGTHALFQDKVAFNHLGLVIIDEQHRFGVLQRAKLAAKSLQHLTPHQLFVTATPIPRTLAMTQFSHFDLSIIAQLPQGRKIIKTAVMPQDRRDDIIQRLITNQGQIYWVCTRIDQDEKAEQQATAEIYNYLQKKLPSAKIAMVHGKLKADDKEQIMLDFKQGNYDILVATTVIEVGVDVPNANIIVIENAEKLGLSQLHQLRGRVGRGDKDSYCILMYSTPLTPIGQQRLKTIKESNDGFWLAEQDMQLRGYGDVFGTQQSGLTEFKVAKFPEHTPMLELAQQIAQELVYKQAPIIDTIMDLWRNDDKHFFTV